MTCPSELRGLCCSFKCVSGKQCEVKGLSSFFGHSRKVGFPDFSLCAGEKRELSIAWLVSFGCLSDRHSRTG